MRLHFRLVAVSLLTLSIGIQAAPMAPVSLQIDAGAVEVTFIDAPEAPPVQLRHRTQGSYQPDVAITTSGDTIRATHIASCHGTGNNQGTVFQLAVNGAQSLNLALNAGVVTRGVRDNGCCAMADKVRYGAIRVAKPDATVTFTVAGAP